MHKPKVILVIMDGWGYSPTKKGNAILEANTPTFDELWANYDHTLLSAFGENVGLPWGAIGSSEVGHTSIGCGRLVNQELSEIDREIRSKDFFKNQVFSKFLAKSNDKAIHLVGLVSNGGVHSNMNHLFAILNLLKTRGVKQDIFIHAITDGRDTSPKSATQYLAELSKEIKKIGINAKIATVCGRYYAMDRDSRWERTSKAYLAMTQSKGIVAKDPISGIEEQYKKDITDEFIEPFVITNAQSESGTFLSKIFNKKSETSELMTKKIEKGENIIFFNIRPDRMRQIVEMFIFKKDDAKTVPVEAANILTLTTYNEFLPVMVAYPSVKIKDSLARILSDHKIKQGHFAETEKYAHVTYFFNGGNPEPNPLETWNVVSSPKVKTYDQKPEMSANEITDKVIETIKKEKLEFVLINYANADMVGHTGEYRKVIRAVETVDRQLKRLLAYLPETTLMITADHGNAECMVHPETGEIDKKHTVNPVPFILVNNTYKKLTPSSIAVSPTGILADIAPTILEFFGLKKTPDMNGVSLTKTIKG